MSEKFKIETVIKLISYSFIIAGCGGLSNVMTSLSLICLWMTVFTFCTCKNIHCLDYYVLEIFQISKYLHIPNKEQVTGFTKVSAAKPEIFC